MGPSIYIDGPKTRAMEKLKGNYLVVTITFHLHFTFRLTFKA